MEIFLLHFVTVSDTVSHIQLFAVEVVSMATVFNQNSVSAIRIGPVPSAMKVLIRIYCYMHDYVLFTYTNSELPLIQLPEVRIPYKNLAIK